MASPGAATVSIQRSPKFASHTALVVGVLALVATFAFLLAAIENFTFPTTWRSHVVAAHPEPEHAKTGSRRWQLDGAWATNRGPVPAASARHQMIYGAWHTTESFRWTAEKPTFGGAAERWDLRQDLVDMAAAQRRHWTPGNTSTVHHTIDSDDRIANALFGSW
jgi:hypothetical protein